MKNEQDKIIERINSSSMLTARNKRILIEHSEYIFDESSENLDEFISEFESWCFIKGITGLNKTNKLKDSKFLEYSQKLLDHIGDSSFVFDEEEQLRIALKKAISDPHIFYKPKKEHGFKTKEQLKKVLRPLVKKRTVQIDNFINSL